MGRTKDRHQTRAQQARAYGPNAASPLLHNQTLVAFAHQQQTSGVRNPVGCKARNVCDLTIYKKKKSANTLSYTFSLGPHQLIRTKSVLNSGSPRPRCFEWPSASTPRKSSLSCRPPGNLPVWFTGDILNQENFSYPI